MTSTLPSFSKVFKFGEEENKIQVFGTSEEPWFRGKTVAGLLGYSNVRDALSKHVRDKYKAKYGILVEKLGGSDSRPLSTNESNTIYINEAGLYSLIMKSKLALAETFQDWVFEEVLPSIRKTGQYKINKQMKALKIKLRDKTRLIKAKTEELEAKTALIEEERKKNIKWSEFAEKAKELESDQLFYIATSPVLASQNRFKIGGVQSQKHLKSRLASYNTGRAEDNKMYYVYHAKCNDYKVIENMLGSLIRLFKDKEGSKKEMIHMNFTCLVELVEFIVSNYTRGLEFINDNVSRYLKTTIEDDPVIPPVDEMQDLRAIILRDPGGEIKSDVINGNDGDDYGDTKIISLAGWSDEQIKELLITLVNKYANGPDSTLETPYDYNTDKDNVEITLAWYEFKSMLKKYRGLTLSEWRPYLKTLREEAGPMHICWNKSRVD